jgi:NAD(P)H-dependent FMN reductase
MEDIQIAAFSGSLRKGSYTTRLVRAFQKHAPDGINT